MLDDQGHLGLAEGLSGLGREREAHEVDGGELAALLVGVAALEVAHDDVRPHPHPDVVARVGAEALVHDGLPVRRLACRATQRRRSLAYTGREAGGALSL